MISKHRVKITEILILALPAIIEMALNTLLNLADTLMISRIIGKSGLSAAGFANQIIFTFIYIFSSFNAGATAMVARSYGERNYRRLNKIFAENITLNLIIGLIIFVFTLTMTRNILSFFDFSEQVFVLSTAYLKTISWSIPFMFFSFAVAAGLRGAGDTRTPMYITGTANILNIIGNYVLITGYGIFPEMGITGAALSTVISRGIGSAAYLCMILKGKSKIKLNLPEMKLTKKIIQPLWHFSYAAGLEQFSMQLSFFIIGIVISQLPTTSEAAYRILINVEAISYMPAIGMAIATATLTGKYLGEENPDESMKTGLMAAGMGIIWGLFIGVIFFIIPVPIIKIFTLETEVIAESVYTLHIAGINQAPLAFLIIICGALRGTGDTRGVMIINALRLWLVFLPLAYYFIIILDKGVAGAWFAELIAFTTFSIIAYRRFRKMKWAEITIF